MTVARYVTGCVAVTKNTNFDDNNGDKHRVDERRHNGNGHVMEFVYFRQILFYKIMALLWKKSIGKKFF